MSFRAENAQRQTAFRHAVLDNGYTPLPNHDKRCFLKGWNTLRPSHEDIDGWERKLVYQATGLLVTDGLCAIDVDIDDPDLMKELWKRACGQYPQLREALVRFGAGAKELWLCRTDEQFSVLFSSLHVKPGYDPENSDAPSYRLEAFGGGHPRQVGAYGAHTMNRKNDGFEVEYRWLDDETPADVLLDALPLLPKSAVLGVAQIAHTLMEEKGWPRVTRSKTGEASAASVYDLTEDMTFNCLDGVTRTLDQLAEYATLDGNARCSASWLGDPQMVNRTRCLISVDHEGAVSVLETANWTRHLPASLADRERSLGDKMADLSAKLEDVGFEFDGDTYFDAPPAFQDVVLKLLHDWAWCGARPDACLPVYRDESKSQTLGNLRLTMAQHCYEREGPRGGVVKINPVDAWINHSQRQDVDGYRFMPEDVVGVHYSPKDDEWAINSYRAPNLPQVDDDAARREYTKLWLDFLQHLLPVEEEREWFMSWLAHKKQNLSIPGVGVVMYAARFGVGRGTLIDMLGGVFGEAYMSNVSAATLMGQSSQSQYTDWLADALFVTTEEVLPDGDDGASMVWRRKKAYEMLKERIDTRPRRMEIVRKGQPNYQDWVVASFLLATNHDNAIPLPAGDRRMSILTNGGVTLTENVELKQRIDAVRSPRPNMDFIRCVADWLDARDVSRFDAFNAPHFEGKLRMMEANVSELENIVDAALADMPHDWAPLSAILHRVENTLLRLDMKDSYPAWRKQATDHVKTRWRLHKRMYVGERTAKHLIMVRDEAAARIFDAASPDVRVDELRDSMSLETPASAKLQGLRAGLKAVEED